MTKIRNLRQNPSELNGFRLDHTIGSYKTVEAAIVRLPFLLFKNKAETLDVVFF